MRRDIEEVRKEMKRMTRAPDTNLIKSWEDVVGELDLSDGCGAVGCESNTERNNSLFTQRRIEDAIATWKRLRGAKLSER